MLRVLYQSEHCCCKNVIARWREQYPEDYDFGDGETSKKINMKLVKLGPKASKLEMDLVIGNGLWTRLNCDMCLGVCDKATLFEDGCNKMVVCFECIENAYLLFKKVT